MQSFRPQTPILSTEGMRTADRRTMEEFGISGATLMENAARGALARIEAYYGPAKELEVLVLAGSGNNGGDGLALARMIVCAGGAAFVVTTATKSNASEGAAHQLRLLNTLAGDERYDLEVMRVGNSFDPDRFHAAISEWGEPRVCVDALLGIGCNGTLREPVRSLAEAMVPYPAVMALDVPTGICSDTGACLDRRAVQTELTVTFGALKPGLLFGEGRERAGEVQVVDIGIPPHLVESAASIEGAGFVPKPEWGEHLLPVRSVGAHKFSVGQLAVVAGSDRYPGAAMLCTRAAARVGAGYVTCFTSASTKTALDASTPEVAALALDEATSAASIFENVPKARALLVGPGLDRGIRQEALVRELLDRAEVPIVIDADGLNAVANEAGIEALERTPASTVITPHAGEFARLVAATGAAASTESNLAPHVLAARWAARWGVVVVLKGAPTVIAAPGQTPYVANSIHPGFATAGTGDVLAGMIAGLLAQGARSVDAAVCAIEEGARAMARVAKSKDVRSIVASDLIEEIGRRT